MSFYVIWLVPMLINLALLLLMGWYDYKEGKSLSVDLGELIIFILFVLVPILNIFGTLCIIGFLLSDLAPSIHLFTIRKKD